MQPYRASNRTTDIRLKIGIAIALLWTILPLALVLLFIISLFVTASGSSL